MTAIKTANASSLETAGTLSARRTKLFPEHD